MFKQARNGAMQLARQFASDYPASLQALSGRKSLDMYQKALINLKNQAQTLQRENRFGIFSRIVLAKSFQSTLAGLSYSSNIQRQATSELASAVTFVLK